MPALFTTNRIFYVSKNETTGLTDVELYLKLPDMTLEGPFVMTELTDAPLTGTYYYDYVPTQQGTYLVSVDSVSNPKKAEQKFEVYQKSPFAMY